MADRHASGIVPIFVAALLGGIFSLWRDVLVRFAGSLVPALCGCIIGLLYWAPGFLRQWQGYITYSMAVITFLLLPPHISNGKFYELAAQVAPVLFLALAIEHQAFRSQSILALPPRQQVRHYGNFVFQAATPALFLVLAGVESMRALTMDHQDHARFDLVAAALIAATISLLLTAIVGPYRQQITPAQDQERVESARSCRTDDTE